MRPMSSVLTATAATAAVLAATFATVPNEAAADPARRPAPAAPTTKLVPVTKAAVRTQPSGARAPEYAPAKWQAPAAGSARILGGIAAHAGGFTVTASPATTTKDAARKGEPAIDVTLSRLVDGTVRLSVQQPSGQQRWTGNLTLDAEQLAPPSQTDRLQAIDVTTCDAAGPCAVRPVPLTRDSAAGTVTVAAAAGTTLALAPGANGSAGNYAATSLNPASSWGVSEQFGSFSWAYPMRVPPAASGLGPQLQVGYDSGSVDGRVASTNNQASWVGEGFDLRPGGYISREFVSCADDMTGGSNASRKTSDLCWGKDNATLVLDGRASRLVRDATTGTWKLKEDNGSTVVRLSGAGNGDTGTVAADTGEYWLLTDTTGTKYYFGLEKRYATDPTTRSATWTVPVNGNHSGEQCYNATFASGFCAQAWRWNLAYVVDLRGNTTTYNYVKETNRYGQNLDTKSVAYDRGGYLSSVEYGQVAGTETATNAHQRVLFDVAERCLPSGTITCDPAQLTAANAAYWPDVPQDQICTATTTCGAGHAAPAFFTRKRLVAVRTQVMKAGALADVERWNLTQSFPPSGDGTPASLQLDRIQHTGLVGGTASTPPVVFSRIQLPNRVDMGTSDGDAQLIKWRVSSVKTESGGTVSVNYAAADCATGSLPASADSNTRRCFPNYWSPPGAITPTLGWFHKYVVASVVADGAVAPSQPTVTRYTYVGTPAWHYDDNVVQPAKYRTWSEFRGFATVDTITGEVAEPNPLRTRTTFYRGMNGDRRADGTTKSVSVTDSTGATTPDSDWFNGLAREDIAYNGAAEVSGTISTPWASAVTATDASGSARIVRSGQTVNSRQTRAGQTPFTTRVVTTFDPAGNATQVADSGDLSTTSDDRCTTSTYVTNAGLNLKGLIATTRTVAVACGATVGAGDITSETHTFYDGATAVTTTPTRGEPTMTKVRDDSGMVTAATTTYDTLGRVKTTADALGRVTTTTYTPADHQPTTAVAVTDPKGFTATTTLEPAFGAQTKMVDANARATSYALDPLGRTTKVWLANRPTYQSPSYQFDYLIRQDGANAVTSSTLHYLASARITTTQLYDGLLRPIQTQTQSGSGNRVVADTIYDTRGLAKASRGPWVSSGLPATDAVAAPDASIDRVVTTAYDGAGRPTRATTWVLGTEKFHTDNVYNGDSVDTLPPPGGTATRTVVDARGRQTQLWQYQGSVVTAGKDVTTYTVNNKDQLTKVTNQAGITWSYGFNQLGQLTQEVDPDRGTTTTSYDLVGNVKKVTDAQGRVINRTYDELDRPATVTDGAGALLAQWTYDTVPSGKGQLASATSYSGGAPYTDRVDSYDAVYNVKGNTVIIPAAETGLAGSYTYTRNYNVDGSLGFVNMPAVGNLAAEQYAYQRDATNLPINLLAAGNIVSGVVRDGFGRLSQYVLQTLDVGTTVTQSYETGLGRLATYRVDRDNVATPDLNATFGYDPFGNITSIADVPDPANTSRTDRQCFQYTWAGELAEAWANGAGACASTPSFVNSGAAPYWMSWTYDTAHRRATQTRHGATASTDTVDTYTYPGVGSVPNGTTGGAHAASSVSTKVGAGTPTVATATYDMTGNVKTSPLPAGGTGSFTWDGQGRLATVAKAGVAGASANVYASDGSLLVRRNANGSKTLFLGDTQVTYTPAAGTTPASTTAVRLFEFEGAVVAYRTAPGYAGVVFQPPGYQGTALVQTDGAGSGAGFAVRRFTPFGTLRGSGSGTWQLSRGFLGSTGPAAVTDPTSGLVHLGAREYDPAMGRFLSVDPLMDMTDPTQWNAYSYAQNSPVTLSDPQGDRPLGAGDTGCTNCKTSKNTSASGSSGKKSSYSWNYGNERLGSHSVYGTRSASYRYSGGRNYRRYGWSSNDLASRARSAPRTTRPKQSWSLLPTRRDLGLASVDTANEYGGYVDDNIVRVSGYSSGSGASVDPYVRWKARNYAAPGSQILRPVMGAKSATRVIGAVRWLGRASVLTSAASAAYSTYEYDSFYDDDPTRSVNGWRKLGHAANSAVLTSIGSALGVGVGAQLGSDAGFAGGGTVGGPVGAGVGSVVGAGVGAVGGGYLGGQMGSLLAVNLNAGF